MPEEYGGDTMFVDVSARNNINIDQLLEAILLTADAALELTANPHKAARGVAIEANLDKGRGAVVTVLVQTGTLRVGDTMVVGSAHGRVRALFASIAIFVTLLGAIRLFVFPAGDVVLPLVLGGLFALVNAAWLVCAFNPGLATTFLRRRA